jgi:hypothetical protein
MQLCGDVRSDQIRASSPRCGDLDDRAVVEPEAQEERAGSQTAHSGRGVLEVLREATGQQQDAAQEQATVDNEDVVDPHRVVEPT